jgi:hypothetical protein
MIFILLGIGCAFINPILGGVLMIIGLALLASKFTTIDMGQAVMPVPPDCPPHKWTYDAQGFLFCNNCKQRPGEISTNYDKPY